MGRSSMKGGVVTEPVDSIKLGRLPSPRSLTSRSREDPSPSQSAAMVPLFLAALLLMSGICLSRLGYLRPAWLLLSLCLLVVISVLAILRASRLRWLPIGLIWLGLGFWSAEMQPDPSASSAVAALSDGLLRTVEGTVIEAGPIREAQRELNSGDSAEDPEQSTVLTRDARTLQHIDLRLSAAEVITERSDEMQPLKDAEATIRLSVAFPNPNGPPITCGQRLRAVIRMLPPEVYHDPGVWSRETFLESQEISATSSVEPDQKDSGIARLIVLQPSPSHSPACWLNGWRNLASERLAALPTVTQSLPRVFRATPEDAAMLTALLTGDRTWLSRGIRVGFERTGSFHLIVVSGLHLAILAGCVSMAARRLRLPRWPATLLTVAITLGYALFTGFAIPAQRSFWMITVYLIGRLLFRDRSPLNVIGFATLTIAAVSPRSIFDASLQMTVLSVAAIAGIALPLLGLNLHAWLNATRNLETIDLDPKLAPAIAQFRVTLRLIARRLEAATNAWAAWNLLSWLIRLFLRMGELLFVTLVVELALAMPMALYFHRITVYALPVNLLILPLLALLVPAAMLLLLALGLVSVLGNWIAAIPAVVCLALLHLSVFVVRVLGEMAFGNLRIPGPTAFQTIAAILLFVVALLFARGLLQWPARRSIAAKRRVAFALLVSMAVVALWPRSVAHPAAALLFEVIDVGQGDSLLLITPDGKTLLVDGGGVGLPFITHSSAHKGGAQAAAQSSSDFDVGEEVVSPVLWSRGIRRLDVVALTHAHHDHMGGLPAILRNFRPKELWVGNNPPVPAYGALLKTASMGGTHVRQLHAGDTQTLGDMLFRVLAPEQDYQPSSEPRNDDSLVMQVVFNKTSILLEGDAEAAEEHVVLKASGLKSSILKVGHHGSLTSTRPELLNQVQPAWAAISCGRRNHFGHPRAEILAELQAAHARTFRTDLDGATCLLLDGQSVKAQPMCTGIPW